MFSFFILPWVFLLGLAIQKIESPTKNQQRRIRRYRVVCPYSLPDGVDLWKLRMRERYGSPFPGAPEQWYLEDIIDVVCNWNMAKGNHTINTVVRYGLKSTACEKQSRTYPVYSDLTNVRFHLNDVYDCVAFYKEGWVYPRKPIQISDAFRQELQQVLEKKLQNILKQKEKVIEKPFDSQKFVNDFFSSMNKQQQNQLNRRINQTRKIKEYKPPCFLNSIKEELF